MTKIKQIEHFQTHVHRFSLLMPTGDFHHHHTLYIMYASRFKSPKKQTGFVQSLKQVKTPHPKTGISACRIRVTFLCSRWTLSLRIGIQETSDSPHQSLLKCLSETCSFFCVFVAGAKFHLFACIFLRTRMFVCEFFRRMYETVLARVFVLGEAVLFSTLVRDIRLLFSPLCCF